MRTCHVLLLPALSRQIKMAPRGKRPLRVRSVFAIVGGALARARGRRDLHSPAPHGPDVWGGVE